MAWLRYDVKSLVLVLIIVPLVSGCAFAVNRRAAAIFSDGCFTFQVLGKWPQAQSACERAVLNSRLGGVPREDIATLWYEYGKTSGVVCEYRKAERGLRESIEIDQLNDRPVYPAQLEMARLMLARNRIADAVQWYEAYWEGVPGAAIEDDPVAAAEILEEQAYAYRLTGSQGKSEAVRAEAQALRAAHPDAQSFTAITPYGKYCG